ncbi:hypothetical protein MKZ07_00650 [Paenibacillus sp. FSL P4-0338]|uniref:DUF6843 domain-containing protein n=1 Tax=unclassified Paenibacillus TaxID=185978 RepID=UPI0003E1E2E9|nr:hypothetical protein [Paenibacillus sp. FSL R7-269]ETT53534.1 hypothetical protein C162_07259 [Paenibacillus sp. FSL R7-269]
MKKTLFLLIPLLLLVLAFCSTNKRNPNLYLIPNNYVGWVQIIYNQEGFNAIEKNNGKNIFTIPESGVLKTSTPDPEYGISFEEFYYYDEQNKQQKLDVDQMIHHHTIGDGESVSSSGKIEGPTVQRFFVGTEAELQNHPAPDYPVELMKPASSNGPRP